MAVWLKLLLLSLVWVGIGTLFAVQMTVFDKVPARMAFFFALMDWGPWILISPLVLWLGSRLHISASTWKWVLPAHIFASIFVAISLEMMVQFSFSHHWNDRPAPPNPEQKFEDPGRVGPPPPPRDGGGTASDGHDPGSF